jgi:hypothetical protein
MVDVTSRAHLRTALQAMVTGRRTTDDFIDCIDSLKTNDVAVDQIGEFGLELFDDEFGPDRLNGAHRVVGPLRKTVVRSLLFLRSKREYEWPTYPQCEILGCLAFAGVVLVGLDAALLAMFVPALLNGRLKGDDGVIWIATGIAAVAGAGLIAAFIVASRSIDAEWKACGDFEVWPYIRTEDLDVDRSRVVGLAPQL